jgi:hypothetical protein
MLITQLLLVRMLVVTQLVHPQSTLIYFRAGIAEVLVVLVQILLSNEHIFYQVVRLTLLI